MPIKDEGIRIKEDKKIDHFSPQKIVAGKWGPFGDPFPFVVIR
jgi:hypothetical protein